MTRDSRWTSQEARISRQSRRPKTSASNFLGVVSRGSRPWCASGTHRGRQSRELTFASSANPSGVGNKGRVDGIGQRIGAEADLIIAADDYVASMQPGKTVDSRHEQGVMVSMVDESGKLIPEQHGQRSVLPCPTLIRRGLDCDRIMENLAITFLSWDYRQGTYY